MVTARTVIRYHTKHKNRAFMFMRNQNKIKGRNTWRVAATINNRVVFDIDNHDINNVKSIIDYYSACLKCHFKAIRTHGGYHIISDRYDDNNTLQWQYGVCRVLNPLLETENLQKYIEAVQKWYIDERKNQTFNGDDFLQYYAQKFKRSGLYCGHGNFDILFATNVIMKGYYCLRISKKSVDDNPKEITI